MASLPGRGAQVRLDGDAQKVARGAGATSIVQSLEAKRLLEQQGVSAGGYTPDGSTNIGGAADDEVITPAGVVPDPGSISLGNLPFAMSLNNSVITEVINGITVTTTVGSGLITEVYGAPVNETWQTVLAAGSISKSRIS